MSPEAEQKVFVLRALRRMHGMPMPDSTLTSSVQLAFPGQTPSLVEVRCLLADMEADGFVSAVTDEITGKVWTLTVKGSAKAAQLG